jgi:hypothetical protein
VVDAPAPHDKLDFAVLRCERSNSDRRVAEQGREVTLWNQGNPMVEPHFPFIFPWMVEPHFPSIFPWSGFLEISERDSALPNPRMETTMHSMEETRSDMANMPRVCPPRHKERTWC